MLEKHFTINDTNIVKGIAIVCMVVHHVFVNDAGLSILQPNGTDIYQIIGSACKVCVALFTILSGYGLCASYKKFNNIKFKSVRFVISRYIKLLSIYWPILLTSYLIILLFNGRGYFQILYSGNVPFVAQLIIDIFGLSKIFGTNSFIGGWFLTAIIIMYFIFPLVNYLIRRFKIIFVLILYLPWVYYLICNDITMKTDSVIFYLCDFALGIYLYEYNILDKLVSYRKRFMILISLFIMFLAVFLRLIFTLPLDIFVAFSIILVEIFAIRKINLLNDLLILFGKNSANIWLLHSLITMLLITYFSFSPVKLLLVALFLSLSVSLLVLNICKVFKIEQLFSLLRRPFERK